LSDHHRDGETSVSPSRQKLKNFTPSSFRTLYNCLWRPPRRQTACLVVGFLEGESFSFFVTHSLFPLLLVFPLSLSPLPPSLSPSLSFSFSPSSTTPPLFLSFSLSLPLLCPSLVFSVGFFLFFSSNLLPLFHFTFLHWTPLSSALSHSHSYSLYSTPFYSILLLSLPLRLSISTPFPSFLPPSLPPTLYLSLTHSLANSITIPSLLNRPV
jgi:hypothetical protein